MEISANCLNKKGNFSSFDRAWIYVNERGVQFNLYWEVWQFEYPAPSRTWTEQTLGM